MRDATAMPLADRQRAGRRVRRFLLASVALGSLLVAAVSSGGSAAANLTTVSSGAPVAARLLAGDDCVSHVARKVRKTRTARKARKVAKRLRRLGLDCAFRDEFNGTTLNTNKWLVQETWFSGMTGPNQDCYINDPRNISVRGGYLRLTARMLATPMKCKSPYGDFETKATAATVATAGRFEQTFGRYSVRARFPAVRTSGHHSAIWLYPAEHTYGAWPYSGEIDIAEWFSAAPANVYPSAHYSGEPVFGSTGFDCRIARPDQFHTYSVEWTPTQMRFEYDGKLCFTHSWSETSTLGGGKPFDQPFYVVLTQIFGGDWNKVVPEMSTEATMVVDWVRAWR